ncbi:MAG: tetratricopeptide repeat protein [Phenylobacterium sp.]|nr:MAG: tetratricopeptide repeat protein [Phenylobacterium sp.]
MPALLAQGAAARDAGDFGAAERLYAEAAVRWPDAPQPHHFLGGLFRAQDRLDLAEAAYRRTLAITPGAAGTQRVLATLLLSQGRYAEGFALFEARHQHPTMRKPPLPFPEWRGEDVAGKRLLIWPEQGFGDQIQFARFAPILKARGADVTLICHKELVRLFDQSLGVRVLAAEGAVEFPDPDYWVMQGSLAWRLGCTVETLPAQPYLHHLFAWRPFGAGFKVGLKAAGNPIHENDANRSLSPASRDALHRLPARMIGLDPVWTGARDFADTAAIVDQLDLVISVDTAVAHLAGAMGKPCWVLLPAIDTDWRWLRGRSDSPWYPSVRLYRQARGEDWGPVIDRVAADLQALI